MLDTPTLEEFKECEVAGLQNFKWGRCYSVIRDKHILLDLFICYFILLLSASLSHTHTLLSCSASDADS